MTPAISIGDSVRIREGRHGAGISGAVTRIGPFGVWLKPDRENSWREKYGPVPVDDVEPDLTVPALPGALACPMCGQPVEPFTLADELPGGLAETARCRGCHAIAWTIEDQRRHEAIERRAAWYLAGDVPPFVAVR